MVVLIGDNLGERQRYLNTKVEETVKQNVDFDQLKLEDETSDAQKLFKIDVASKYRNVDYILEVFKSGDSLSISRALKCVWLYDNEHENIINTEYLNDNIFTFMPIKLQKKFLTTLSLHLKDSRAERFYEYCMNNKMSNIAYKFLLFTSESFRIQVLQDQDKLIEISNRENKYVKNFIKDSFSLADVYLSLGPSDHFRTTAFTELSYLYMVSDVEYLDLLEKYRTIDTKLHSYRLGLRTSKDIFKKHKNRILENPLLYLSVLNKRVISTYSTIQDAMVYFEAMLPDSSKTFMDWSFQRVIKEIIHMIPFEQRYSFFKKVLDEKYPEQALEMDYKLYLNNYCKLTTNEDKAEDWALNHIKNEKKIDLYKFVEFKRAFPALKNEIMTTQDTNIQLKILKILIERATKECDVQALLIYFLERHANQEKSFKDGFIDCFLSWFKIYSFDDHTWKLIVKMFHDVGVYNKDLISECEDKFKYYAFIYPIIHKKEIPSVLIEYLDEGFMYPHLFKYFCKSHPEHMDTVYHYLNEFYVNKVKECEKNSSSDTSKNNIIKYVNATLELLDVWHDVINSGNIPEIILSYMFLYWQKFKNHIFFYVSNRVISESEFERFLKDDFLAKCGTIDDAKKYAITLLPDTAYNFWNGRFIDKSKYLLDMIPLNDRFIFLKSIFQDKYPNEKFETCANFYHGRYYELLTEKEREAWAQRQIDNEEEILGSGTDYIWYKFINFKKAFPAIKKYVMISNDSDKRTDMVKILVECAKTKQDLKMLINYFYERHVNETRPNKEQFLNLIIKKHNIYELDYDSWTAFNKILYSLDVFNKANYANCDQTYRYLALIYFIVNNKEVPNILNEFILAKLINDHTVANLCNELDKDKKEMVYQYFINFYTDLVKQCDEQVYNDEMKETIKKHIQSALDLMANWGNKTEDDIPPIIIKYIYLQWESFKYNRILNKTNTSLLQKDYIRLLKTNTNEFVKCIPILKEYIARNNEDGYFKTVISKLKIYFSDNIAKLVLEYYKQLLSLPELSDRVINAATCGIFLLADYEFKKNFMKEHIPVNAKIDHENTDPKLLSIQQAICSFACYSQPPVPLPLMLNYIKVDYVRFCIPMFNMYLANLPPTLCMEFVKSIIDAPLSIQKHGIRLAFQFFSLNDLTNLILDVWKKTKNTSLRMILYKALFDKVIVTKETEQEILFQLLIKLTLELNQDDDDAVFGLLSAKFSDKFMSDHIEAGWKVVSQLPPKVANFERMAKLINHIESQIQWCPSHILDKIIDEHIQVSLIDKQILNTDLKPAEEVLIKRKWNLVASAIVFMSDEKALARNMDVAHKIVKNCAEMWNEIRNEEYIVRNFFSKLIDSFETEAYRCDDRSYYLINILFEAILKDLQESLPLKGVTYELSWILNLSIVTRKVIIYKLQELEDADKKQKKVIVIEKAELLGEELGNLIKKYVDNGIYHVSFANMNLESLITSSIISFQSSWNRYREVDFLNEDIHVLICNGLIKVEMAQVYKVVLTILPKKYDRKCSETFISVRNKINNFDDDDLQYYNYKKYL